MDGWGKGRCKLSPNVQYRAGCKMPNYLVCLSTKPGCHGTSARPVSIPAAPGPGSAERQIGRCGPEGLPPPMPSLGLPTAQTLRKKVHTCPSGKGSLVARRGRGRGGQGDTCPERRGRAEGGRCRPALAAGRAGLGMLLKCSPRKVASAVIP